VTSVSNVGRKRGRGRGVGAKKAKDLNRGQVIGVGPRNVIWPGLNTPILKGKEVARFKELEQNNNYQENLIRIRNEMEFKTKRKVHPLERGWSGTRMLGRWIGPPDPVNGIKFDGFDTKLVSLQGYMTMRRNLGRLKTVKALAVTGNKNGLIGFAAAKAKDGRISVKAARNRAAVRLRKIELDGDTIIHDFYSKFGSTVVFAYKMPPGFGVVAHRCVKAICDVVGIKDIYCKVASSSSNNYLNLTRAFVFGLAQQRSMQAIAEEKRLNVVELRPENDFLPRIVARPIESRVRTREQIEPDEVMEFRQYLHDGKIREIKYKAPPFYTRNIGYGNYLKQYHYQRSRQDVRIYLKAKYGKVESFLNIQEREERAERKRQLAASGQSESLAE
jgi:small subunit ribosomal protein S5